MGFIPYDQAEKILARTRNKVSKRFRPNLKLQWVDVDCIAWMLYDRPLVQMYRDGSVRLFQYGMSITSSCNFQQFSPVRVKCKQVKGVRTPFIHRTPYYHGMRLRYVEGEWLFCPHPDDIVPITCPVCGEKDMKWDVDVCTICADKEKEAGTREM